MIQRWWKMTLHHSPSFSWQPVIKTNAIRYGGLWDHSMLGWLCQHQSNLGCISDGGHSKKPALAVSYGSPPQRVFSTRSLGGRVPPRGARRGEKKSWWEVTASSPPRTALTSSLFWSAGVKGMKFVIWAGLITHDVKYMLNTLHFIKLAATVTWKPLPLNSQ